MENQPVGNTVSRYETSGPFVRRQWRVYQYAPKRGYDGHYVPPHLCHLFDAVERIGQYYLEGWTGEERTTRGESTKPTSPLDQDANHEEQRRIFLADGSPKMVSLEKASEWWSINRDALFIE